MRVWSFSASFVRSQPPPSMYAPIKASWFISSPDRGDLLPLDGHDDRYDEEEMYRLNPLRETGDSYVREQPGSARLVQP